MSRNSENAALLLDNSVNSYFYWFWKKFRIILAAVLCFAVILLCFKYLEIDSQPNPLSLAKKSPIKKKRINILWWVSVYGHPEWYTDKNGELTEKALKNFDCPATNCFFTHDRNYFGDETKFDAILFHGGQNISLMMPRRRGPRQIYIFTTLEAPTVTRDNLSVFDNFYNLTMTYRMDSDIFWSYGKIFDLTTNETVGPGSNPQWKQPEEDFYDEEVMKIIRNKSKSIAWFASKCVTPSRREELVKKIQSLIDVDIFGKCGTKQCSSGCDSLLKTTYRFYLSFENALCVDYQSEKMYRPLEQYSVPIVYSGTKNVSLYAPPHSYINANDYDTVEDLVKYLKYLIDNPKEYIKFFWWRKHYRVNTYDNDIHTFCHLCEKLNDDNFMSQRHVYEDIKDWFIDNKCNQTSIIKF